MSFDKVAPSMGVGSFATPWVEELRRHGELMAEARILTGKSDDEIRAAAAQSPLSFADFVRLLRTGHKI